MSSVILCTRQGHILHTYKMLADRVIKSDGHLSFILHDLHDINSSLKHLLPLASEPPGFPPASLVASSRLLLWVSLALPIPLTVDIYWVPSLCQALLQAPEIYQEMEQVKSSALMELKGN